MGGISDKIADGVDARCPIFEKSKSIVRMLCSLSDTGNVNRTLREAFEGDSIATV